MPGPRHFVKARPVKFTQYQDKKQVIEDMLKHKPRGSRSVPTISEIIHSYLMIMMQAVVDGKRVHIPGFGEIYIAKRIMKEPKLFDSPSKHNKKFKGQVYMLNPRRIGFKYNFIFDSEVMRKYGYNLYTAEKWRDMLSKILRETDKEYPMFEEKAA